MEAQEQVLLQEAVRIGDQLLRQSCINRHGRYWKTINQVGKEIHWEKQSNLYNGVSGIALFLLTLYQHTQREQYRTVAWEALQWVGNQPEPEHHSLALLTGRFSLPFAWLNAHRILGEEEALSYALRQTTPLLSPPGSDTAAEYINGMAGTVIALLHLHAASQDERLLHALDRYVTQLIASVHFGREGLYWDRSGTSIRGLCGFSHGASGVGYAFLELGHYFQNPTFFWIAEQAFRYERAYYHPSIKNWPDFRKSLLTEEDEHAFSEAYQRGDLKFFTQGTGMNAWCHGAAGVGLSRLRAYELLGKLIYHDESLWALEKTRETDLQSPEQMTFSLCHGRGGNAELFLEAFRVLNDVRYWQQAQQVAESALNIRQKQGEYRSGTQYVGEDSSLFNGNAGIGYFYLRVLFPRKVPSLLAPKLTDTYSGAASLDDFPSLSLSIAEVQEQLLNKRFPRTLHLIRQWTPAWDRTARPFDSSEALIFQRPVWKEYVVRQSSLLPVEQRARLLDAWMLDDARSALDENVVSDILLKYKQYRKAADAERLLELDEPGLGQEQLGLDPDIALLATSWDWSCDVASTEENNLPQCSEDYAILLIPTVYGVQYQPLNVFAQTLLDAFEEEKTVAEGMQLVRRQIADSSSDPKIEALMLQQIRAAIRAGLLIVPANHTFQVTSLYRNHSITSTTT